MYPRALSNPHPGLALNALRMDPIACQQSVYRQPPQVRRIAQSIDITCNPKARALPAHSLQPALEQRGCVQAGASAQHTQVKSRAVAIYCHGHGTAVVQMVLDERFVIDFNVRPYSLRHHEIGAILRVLQERVLARLPELLARSLYVRHVASENSVVCKPGVLGRTVTDHTDTGYTEAVQPLDNPFHYRYSKNINICERYAADGFCPGRTFARGASDQYDCSYVHDCHLGAAARKIAERDGTHAGIRRNRDIGSSARARC